MTIEFSFVHLWFVVGGAALLMLGFYLGKRAKLNELHRLQEEGFVSISYNKHPGQPARRGARKPSRIDDLVHEDHDEDDEHIEIASYKRRDSEERREDWAIKTTLPEKTREENKDS